METVLFKHYVPNHTRVDCQKQDDKVGTSQRIGLCQQFIRLGNKLVEKAGYRVKTVVIAFGIDTITCLNADRWTDPKYRRVECA